MATDGMKPLRRRLSAATATSVLLAAVAGGCGDDDRQSPSARTNPAPTTTTTRPEAGAPRYRDGDYEARGWYGGQPSSIDVELTLRDGRVTAVDVTTNATNPTSLDLQERFAEAVPDEVVGRPIDEVEVGRLAGSSGTPDGFNDALDKIRAQAAR
jgi:uncharacterized protein with FMN-binding domain